MNLPALQGTQVQLLAWEVSLEKGKATHPVFLPQTEEPGGSQSRAQQND